MSERRIPTYGTYLQLQKLLSAQRPPDYARLAPGDPADTATRDLLHHDEHLFIVVHQVFELWFNLILHELDFARDLLGRTQVASRTETVAERDIPNIVATVERVNEILRIGATNFRVIETMHPINFLHFRDAISPASGFQSFQFRELEILAGLPEAHRERAGGGSYSLYLNAEDRARLERRLKEMTLKDALLDWLRRTPIEKAYPNFAPDFIAAFDRYADEQIAVQEGNPHLTPGEHALATRRSEELKKSVREYFNGHDDGLNSAHRAFVFIATYRDEPLLRWPSVLLDRLVEFEQSFREFRFRHARMVERMIGLRVGTGGSPGLSYLEQTANYRIFGQLLEARNFLIARRYLKDVPRPEVLRFRFGE